jgi:hypothetical protein
MSDDSESKAESRRVRKEPLTRSRTRRKAKSSPEELGSERRLELAQQIEAKRFRGRPPSI